MSKSYSQRPTLPPLHTLGLPISIKRNLRYPSPERHASHDPKLPTPVSSSSSRTPSPSFPPPRTTPTNIHLTPSTLESAQAAVFVLPSPPPSPPSLRDAPTPKHSQAFLLFGPALRHVQRHPEHLVSKGARIHPYRVAGVKKADNQKGSPSSRITASYPSNEMNPGATKEDMSRSDVSTSTITCSHISPSSCRPR